MKKLLFSLVFCAMCSRNEAVNYWPMIMSGTPNTLKILATVTEIPNDVYAERENIHYIEFQHNGVLVVIGDYAFKACGLREVCIPASVKQLCRGCFDRCASLKRVTFMPGSNLELIGHYAFAESALESIEIPSSVIELGDNCFCECRSLRYVRFMPGGNWWRIVLSALVAIGDDPIEVEDDVSRYLASCEHLQDIYIGHDLMLPAIGKRIFAGSSVQRIHVRSELVRDFFERCLANAEFGDLATAPEIILE